MNEIKWWLMSCDFPDLNWARQAYISDGRIEVLDSDGTCHYFDDRESSDHWLSEDEFIEFDGISAADGAEYDINVDEIAPPAATNDTELVKLMRVKRS